MINRNSADVQAALTGEKNGLISFPGWSIPDLSKLYTDDNSQYTSTKLSYDDFASVLGDTAAFKKYLEDLDYQSPVNEDRRNRIWSLYLEINAAPYTGKQVNPVLYDIGRDPVGKIFHSYFTRTKGYDQDPEKILALKIDDAPIAVFDPELRIMLPAAEYTGLTDLHSYIEENLHIVKRTCTYIRMLCDDLPPAFRTKFYNVFKDLMAGFTEGELLQEAFFLRSEPLVHLRDDVTAYLNRVSPTSSAALICGLPGENTNNVLLQRPCLITVNTDAATSSIGREWRIREDLVMIPPVTPDNGRPDHMSCTTGSSSDGSVWAEVNIKYPGTTHRRIYSLGRNCINYVIANPDSIVDMQAGTPVGLFRKYNYLEQGSTAAVRYPTIPNCKWTLLPLSSTEISDDLGSRQDPDRRWMIYQRECPVTHLQLTDDAGTLLGTLFVPDRPTFEMTENTVMNVAFDLGSSRSVRIATIEGTGRFDQLESPDTDTISFMSPLTPMSFRDLREIEEFSFDRLGDGNTYIEPLVQRFNFQSVEKYAADTSGLLARHRIWRPDMDVLFEALIQDTGSMNDARTRVGVDAAPKERLSNSDLSEEDRYEARFALRFYIGTLFMETIFRAAKRGYSFAKENLQFGVSFPDNGIDTGLTREVKDAILGASEYVNEYLTPENHLAENSNLFLYAENRATNVWHSKNPPEKKFLGETVAAATSDCGNTTLDFTLSIARHSYSCSIPYAGRNITNASFSEAYNDAPQDLVACFPGVSADLKSRAKEALLAASHATQGRLDQRLGFSMTLSQLFNSCDMRVTGPNADQRMHRMQQLISTKEYVTIPAVAATIARAVKEGDIGLEDDILIAPVGRGSLALDNTSEGFRQSYTLRVMEQLSRLLGKEYKGNILFLPNNDVDKRSVAEGILYMMEGSAADLVNIPLISPGSDLEDHYLDLAYGEQKDERDAARNHLRSLDLPETCAKYRDAFDHLYNKAFNTIIDSYTFEDFENSYNIWALTGRTDGGVTDRMIREEVRNNFRNMIAEARETMEYFIMSCPGVEKEHICGSLLDICLRRIAAEF